jgi:type II secretory pathway pseudopilin PulG
VRSSNQETRVGAVLVCVIACLAVTSVLAALTVQSSLRGRREARLQLQLRQTELLCEAGVMRAVKRLQSSSGYAGEQWQPELNLENYHDVIVDIQVAAVEKEATQPRTLKDVTVIARLDSFLDHDGPMQRTHNFRVQIQTPLTSLGNE